MIVKRIDIIKREDGFFHPGNKPKIKAYKHGEGYGVMVFFEISPIDTDFGEYVWCPKAEELTRMTNMMHETDHMTFKMVGHGWEGVRPFHMLEEFI
jgi:hypothetical protein